MSKAFTRAGVYSEELSRVLRRLDDLVDWERQSRVRGAMRLMRVSAQPARSLLQRLDVNPSSLPAVHVTGSKGKGSVSALIAAGLGTEGVGVFSSPHVERVNERISISGRPISDAALASALSRALDARAQAPTLTDATWFDVVTAAALSEFARAGVRHAVVEAGMGARRDATAVIDAPVAVVTNVLDEHADIIGPTRADIAHEKAGVIRPGAVVVLGLAPDDEVAGVFEAEAMAQTPPAELVLVPPFGPLRDRNAALARAALRALGRDLPDDAVAHTLSTLPARQEAFNVRGVAVMLDGAHVAHSVAAVLREADVPPAVAVVAVSADKDVGAICAAIREAQVQRVVATATGPQRVYMRASALAEELVAAGFSANCVTSDECAETAVLDALAIAATAPVQNGRNVAILGSLHLAGRVRPLLKKLALTSADEAQPAAK